MPIELASFLLPRNGNTFPILEDVYLKGGMRTVATPADLDMIHPMALKDGMIVYVQSTGLHYSFRATQEGTAWDVFNPKTYGFLIIENQPFVVPQSSSEYLYWDQNMSTYEQRVGTAFQEATDKNIFRPRYNDILFQVGGRYEVTISVGITIPPEVTLGPTGMNLFTSEIHSEAGGSFEVGFSSTYEGAALDAYVGLASEMQFQIDLVIPMHIGIDPNDNMSKFIRSTVSNPFDKDITYTQQVAWVRDTNAGVKYRYFPM